MNVSVITACYNFEGRLDTYLKSFLESFQACDVSSQPNFEFVFIIDEPNKNKEFYSILSEQLQSGINLKLRFSVISNESNIGVTRSRNKGARFINEWVNLNDPDWVIYFDVDDIWSIDAVSILSNLESISESHDLVFLPCDVDTIPINQSLLCKSMELGLFCTFIPLQEAIYAWRFSYFQSLLLKFDFIWYEDESESKYFPEDMMFYLSNRDLVFISDKVICHRTYDGGNIAKDWKGTIIKNKSAFRNLVSMHRLNAEIYPYSRELLDYVGYLDYLTK